MTSPREYRPGQAVWRRHPIAFVVLSVCFLLLGIAIVQFASTGIANILGNYEKVGAGHRAIVFLRRCAVVGAVAMALIQVTRRLLPVRGQFHEREVRTWLSQGLSAPSPRETRKRARPRDWRSRLVFVSWLQARRSVGRHRHESRLDRLVDSLVGYAITSRREELFDLPIEKLCGQIGAAAELLVDRLASAGNEKRDVDLLKSLSGRHHAERYLDSLEEVPAKPQGDPSGPPDADTGDGIGSWRETIPSGVADRHRLEQFIQRNIDGLQISVSIRWRRHLLVFAIAVSGMLSIGLLGLRWGDPGWWFSLAATSVVSGYFAGVARDLVAMIERLRG